MGAQRPPSVYFLTLGCPKNEVDSDRMKAAVLASSFALAEDPEHADVVVVNTCSFIQEATEESIAAILGLTNAWVPAGRDRKVVVAGCLPSRYGSDLTESLPEIDAFVPVEQEGALLEVLERVTGVQSASTTAARGAGGTVLRTAQGPSAYLQVSDGCHRRCAFCAIPAIRGPYRSRPLQAILDEARQLVAGGTRELVLVGQDISAYGRDLTGDATGLTLADVVRELARVEGVSWLRLMYVQPDGVTDELLQVMATEPVICRYLDLPLQHASRAVLARMGRPGSAEEYLALIARIRAVMPDVVLRTSLIAGFPGETRSDVGELEEFLRSARIDYAGVFTYSPEEGTPAAVMPGLPARSTRVRRSNRLRETADRIGFEKAAEKVGAVLEVLVEGVDEDGVLVGRWRGQAPDVDGIVMLDRGSRGDLVRARIVDSLGYDLEAEVL